MKAFARALLGVTSAIFAIIAVPAQAQVRITEVAPWSSGSSPFLRDWFEITNVGVAAVGISGWTIDDDSNNPNSALLSGVTNINSGESVIFIERNATDNVSTLIASFKNTWFGGNVPSGLQVGTYLQGVAGGVGFGTGGDAVNIYNGVAGTLQARVTFAGSDATPPLQTFDNAAGLNNTAIALLSVVGTNGAFVALNDVNEVGSPGTIANPVPEPETYAMLLAGLGVLGAIARKRKAA